MIDVTNRLAELEDNLQAYIMRKQMTVLLLSRLKALKCVEELIRKSASRKNLMP